MRKEDKFHEERIFSKIKQMANAKGGEFKGLVDQQLTESKGRNVTSAITAFNEEKMNIREQKKFKIFMAEVESANKIKTPRQLKHLSNTTKKHLEIIIRLTNEVRNLRKIIANVVLSIPQKKFSTEKKTRCRYPESLITVT